MFLGKLTLVILRKAEAVTKLMKSKEKKKRTNISQKLPLLISWAL